MMWIFKIPIARYIDAFLKTKINLNNVIFRPYVLFIKINLHSIKI